MKVTCKIFQGNIQASCMNAKKKSGRNSKKDFGTKFSNFFLGFLFSGKGSNPTKMSDEENLLNRSK